MLSTYIYLIGHLTDSTNTNIPNSGTTTAVTDASRITTLPASTVQTTTIEIGRTTANSTTRNDEG